VKLVAMIMNWIHEAADVDSDTVVFFLQHLLRKELEVLLLELSVIFCCDMSIVHSTI